MPLPPLGARWPLLSLGKAGCGFRRHYLPQMQTAVRSIEVGEMILLWYPRFRTEVA